MFRRFLILALAAAGCLAQCEALADAAATAAKPAASMLTLAGSAEPGTRLTVEGTLVDRGGVPVGGATIHVYQADARGYYTPKNAMDEPNARLSGRLVTDANGRFTLKTIRPGHYPRPMTLDGVVRRIPAHIHMDITAEGHAVRRLQVVFASDTLLAQPYWRDWVSKLGQPVLATRTEGRGLTGRITIELP